ncbi:MAG: hypothetical protein AAGA08_13640 [Pseudomonadota bacterium]
MALIAVILGGLFGFANFLLAIFVFETGFLSALGIYSASGILLSLSIIALTLALQAIMPDHARALQRREPSAHRF